MQIERLSDKWLFEQHAKSTIRAWIRQLRYFYFKRAWGGHANDGDEFQVAFTYTDRQDLILLYFADQVSGAIWLIMKY